MIVVIYGSRYKEASEETKAIVQARIWERIRQLPRDAFVITGGAPGVDTWAEYARKCQDLDGEVMPAKWRENGVYNPRAGFERNARMLDRKPDLVIGFWDGSSNGTKDTTDGATRRGIPVEVQVIP